MEISLTVDGHSGLTWERWSHVAALAERLGFSSLRMSDHYFYQRHRDSLDPYLAFVLLARDTRRIRFGPLVTPVTFRKPVHVGRMAAQIDVLSGGRFVLGLGAGWLEAEHLAYGIAFPSIEERFARLEEALALIKVLWAPGTASYKGKYYRVEEVNCLPKPVSGRVPILIGGNGERRTLPLVARHADEWNCINLSSNAYRRKVESLERNCESVKRNPSTIRRSMQIIGIVGSSKEAIEHLTVALIESISPETSVAPDVFRQQCVADGFIIGGIDEVVDRLGKLSELGLQEVVFLHADTASDELPEFLASEIAPRVTGL